MASSKVVVDSDVLINVLRGDEALADALGRLADEGLVAVTPISIAEIFGGMRPDEEARTRLMLKPLDCLKLTREIGEVAGGFLSRFRRSHGLEIGDAMIAACAYVDNRQLWTFNRKHFPMREVRFFSLRLQ